MSKVLAKDRTSSLSGHELRSGETRKRLVLAAIEVFGQIGYEAATTRELAKQAETNLSAINYHFGGKKELYLAAAQEIADHAAGLIRPLTTVIRVQRFHQTYRLGEIPFGGDAG